MNKAKPFTRFFTAVFSGFLLIYLLGPVFLMVISSFGGGLYLEFPPPYFSTEWYTTFFQNGTWTKALLTSLQIGTIVALIDLVLAGIAAYWLERASLLGSRTVVFTLFILPAMMPVIIYTVAFYTTFAGWGFLSNWMLLTIAHSILAFPYALLIIQAGVSTLNRDLENAARTLGASPITAIRLVSIPLLKWHLMFAALSAFVVSFTEPVTAIFLTSTDTVTLPQKTWEGLRYGIDPRTVVGTALLMYMMLAIFVIIIISRSLHRRFHIEAE